MEDSLRDRLITAVLRIQEQEFGKMIAFIHPETWAKLPEEDRAALEQRGVEVISPNHHELEALGVLMGRATNFELWNPANVFFIPEKDWRKQIAASFLAPGELS